MIKIFIDLGMSGFFYTCMQNHMPNPEYSQYMGSYRTYKEALTTANTMVMTLMALERDSLKDGVEISKKVFITENAKMDMEIYHEHMGIEKLNVILLT
jgi:hypothetical protein